MKGIESLKALLEFTLLSVNKALDIDTNKDKKVSLSEVLSAVTTISFKIPGIFDSLPEVRAEWKDLSREEMDELVKWFADHFDLPAQHDKAEAIIKKVISMVQYNYKFYQEMKALLTV